MCNKKKKRFKHPISIAKLDEVRANVQVFTAYF
jgi:hypothetical protein